jgi:hypothetical protein
MLLVTVCLFAYFMQALLKVPTLGFHEGGW